MSTEIDQLRENFSEIMKLIHQRTYQKSYQQKMCPGQPKLLALIKANEGVTQKELAERNFVKPASITEMLNKLEANQYVYRIPDESDKRIMRVYLTKEGRNLANRSERFIKGLTLKLFDGFTEDELRIFVKLTDKMRNNLQEIGKSDDN